MSDITVTIEHPQSFNSRALAVERTFVATGIVTGRFKKLEASVKVPNTPNPILPNGRFILKKMPGKERTYRWVVEFVIPDKEVDCRLTVVAKNRVAGEKVPVKVDFQVKPAAGLLPPAVEKDPKESPTKTKATPVILYPLETQNIVDERDYLIVYGTRANAPGNTVIGGTVTVTVEENEFVFEQSEVYDNGSSFWTLIFELSELEPTLNDIKIRSINNSNETSAVRNVVIA